MNTTMKTWMPQPGPVSLPTPPEVMLCFLHHAINSYTWKIKRSCFLWTPIFPLLWHLMTCTALPSLIRRRFLRLKHVTWELPNTSWLTTRALLQSRRTLLSNGGWASDQLKNWETRRDHHGKYLQKRDWWELTVVTCVSLNATSIPRHLILRRKQGFHGRLHLPWSTKISHL